MLQHRRAAFAEVLGGQECQERRWTDERWHAAPWWEGNQLAHRFVLFIVTSICLSKILIFAFQQSTLIQGSIGSIRQLRFRNRLSEGSVYALSGFDVSRSNPNFRLSDEPLSIRFNDGTSFDKLPESVRPIPTELFRFRSYNRLLELANTGKQLPGMHLKSNLLDFLHHVST